MVASPRKSRKATSTSTRRLPPKKGKKCISKKQKRKQVKDGAIEGLIIKNCHACKRRAFIELTCEQCGLNFCEMHLVDRYKVALDVVTRRWPCPRCTCLCDCTNCTNFYQKRALGDHEREARIELEKECESLREELQRLHIEVERNVEMCKMAQEHNSTLQQLNESLQQINYRLQADLNSAKDSTKEAGKQRVDKAKKISSVEDTCSSHIDDPLHKNEESAAVKKLEEKCWTQNEQISVQQIELAAVKGQVKETSSSLIDDQLQKNEELAAVNKKLEEKCWSQNQEISVLQIVLAAVKQQMKETSSSLIDDQLQKNEELAAVNKKLEEKCLTQNEQISVQQLELAAVKRQLKMAEDEVYAGERLRKEMNDTIIELKGYLRVFCRVRPLLSDDGHGAENTLSYPAGLAGGRIDLTRSGKKQSFTFDKVFGPDASQENIFLEISELVQSAVDGSRVCIFAYGQTGSGKTHTMVGRPEDPHQKGLIPRSLEKVFETSQALAARGWNYSVHLSILEVHNNTIKDLIDSESGVREKQQKQYKIKQDVDGNTIVDGLTVRHVSTTDEVYKLLKKANKTRSVARTDLNTASSRSHLVLLVRIVGENETTNEKVQGFLYLVDLAGSEDPSQSGVAGETLQETKAINLSLSSLKSVLLAIWNKANSIPIRECKLTYLLKDCFIKRGSKTLMIVNVSPSPSSSGETLRSLQFAEKAKSCEIGSCHRSVQNLETSAAPRPTPCRERSVGRGRIPPREQNAETLKRKVKPTNKDRFEILTYQKNTADLLKDVMSCSRRELEVACENNIVEGSSRIQVQEQDQQTEMG